MAEFRDKKLYLLFDNLFKSVINTLDKKLDSDTKEVLSDTGYGSLFKIFRRYYEIIKQTNEYREFEQFLLQHEKYSKNFTGKYKTQEWVWSKNIEGFVEGLFIEHLRRKGLSDKQDLIDSYYSEFEIFLIDEKIKTIIKTPILVLMTTSQQIKINEQVSIIQLQERRSVSFYENISIVKHVYAFHDLIYEYFTEKISNDTEVENVHKIWQTKRAQIRDLLLVLRLYRKGKIGFLDSQLSYPIFHGGQTWRNFDCDLEDDWNQWNKQRYLLGSEDVDEINQLWKDLHKIDFANKDNKFLLTTINRFMMSYEREYSEDKILDLMICLEALLLDKPLELRFRLAIRTALLLERENSKRSQIYKIIKKGYDLRSGTVHGGDTSTENNIEQEITLENLANEIEDCVRRSIKEFIRRINNNEKREGIIQKLDDSLFEVT